MVKLTLESPLELRSSLRRLKFLQHPVKTCIVLLWPLPWYFKPQDGYHSTEELLKQPSLVKWRQRETDQLTEMPMFVMRDTPLRSLYRLYEDLCTSLPAMGFESKYFFFHPEERWQVSKIPDPRDPDVIRYAILASLAEALADACNRRLQLGLHRDGKIDRNRIVNLEIVPSWTNNVGPIPNRLFLSDNYGSKAGAAIAFGKRNISATVGEIYR